MSHFLFKDAKPRYVKGIWLRIFSLYDDPALGPIIEKYESGYYLHRAVITEYTKSTNTVVIRLWFTKPNEVSKSLGRIREAAKNNANAYVIHENFVVSVRADPNPEWVCEGDLGRGLAGSN